MPTAASSVFLKPLHNRGEGDIAPYLPYEKALLALGEGLDESRWSRANGLQVRAGRSSQRKDCQSPKTTAIYAHVSTHRLQNIKNPMGALMEGKNLNNNNLKDVS
jgi:hypothetical protein